MDLLDDCSLGRIYSSLLCCPFLSVGGDPWKLYNFIHGCLSMNNSRLFFQLDAEGS